MSGLTILQKYPNSFRIDHKDLKDVYQTTYAKGVITEVQKTADDPMAVKSMVKVTVDGVESDYLPLFYHPKAKYWDGTGVGAQDFDSTNNFCKRAWMSFRAGDEVAVLIREGTPVCVLGFADGIPRIGEDAIKVKGGETKYARMSVPQIYSAGSTGPDGLALHLDLKAEQIAKITKNPTTYKSQTILYDYGTLTAYKTTEEEHFYNGFFRRDGTRSWWTPNDVTTHYINEYLKRAKTCQIHLLKVGPILYLIGSIASNYTLEHDEHYYTYTLPPGSPWGPYLTCFTGETSNYPGWIVTEVNECQGPDGCYGPEGGVDGHVANFIAAANVPPDTKPSYDLAAYNADVVTSIEIYAARYSKKLYDSTKSNPPSYDGFSLTGVPSDFIAQTSFISNCDISVKTGGADVNYYTRPHTKAELIAAGIISA